MSVDLFGSSSTSWTCPYCTFINENKLISCALCYQPRPGHKKNKETWGEWFNRKFRRSNSRSSKQNTKEKCDKSYSKEAFKCATQKSFKLDEVPWTCPQCTYGNVSTAVVCEGCGSNKRWNDVINDKVRSHDKPPTVDDGTPVDVIMVDDDDDVMIIDPEGLPSHDHTKCSKCDLNTNAMCLCCDTSNMKLISSDKNNSTFDPAAQWECADCLFYNDNKQSRCTACDCTNKKENVVSINTKSPAPLNPSTYWECPRCSLHNSSKNLQCTACGNRRKHPSVDSPASSFDPVKQWQCANCSLYNDNKQIHCSACNGTKKTAGKSPNVPFDPSTHWRCSVCPVINKMADIQCVTCGSKRKHSKIDTAPFNPAMQWQCAKCSLYNDNTHSQCQACHSTEKTIPTGTVSILNPATHWECIHCSLHNSNSRNRCEACHQRRPKSDIQVIPVTPVRPVIPHTKEISIPSEPETSIDKRTRFYNNHTALMSLSVKNKRDLIDQDALNIYNDILRFCEKVRS